MAAPLVSVVIPVFNNRQYVARSIASALAQTHSAVEVIVVDDCSSDGSREVLAQFEEHIHIVCHDHNQGVSIARNTGAAASRGQFIAYLDADDLWAPNKLAVFVEAFAENGPDVLFAFSDFNRFTWDTDEYFALSNSQLNPLIFSLIKPQRYSKSKSFRLSKSDFFPLLLNGYPVYPSTMVIRRELLSLIGEWNAQFRRNQDFDFSLRAASASDVLYIDESLTNIGRHATNTSADSLAQLRGDIRIIDHHLRDPRYTGKDRRLIRFFRSKRYCGLGYNYLIANDHFQARSCYRQAMTCWPWFGHALVRYLASFARLATVKPLKTSRFRDPIPTTLK